ncbi:hypothetical protein [Hyalangium gracile]|uniref:hypothetical protein n=1 Tax=Hyalangium gracile TaxID=394092 RepID=UPI001CCCFBA1|nr:hypothetical protein [Hyalangium gracile]
MKTLLPRHGGRALVLMALAWLVGCAPSTMSPMVIRMGPGHPENSLLHGGLRTGPRLSAPLAARTSFNPSEQNFAGDRESFSTRQWSMAYDLAITRPLGEKLAMHIGVQGEFYYPVPLPGYGIYGGLSSWYGTPTIGVAPAVVVRGATDFGIESRGGPGTILGTEASASFYFNPEKRVSVGLVPFLGVHQVFSRTDARSTSLYYGGAMVMQFPLGGKDSIELSGGFGRVKASGEAGWNAPILGARWAR